MQSLFPPVALGRRNLAVTVAERQTGRMETPRPSGTRLYIKGRGGGSWKILLHSNVISQPSEQVERPLAANPLRFVTNVKF